MWGVKPVDNGEYLNPNSRGKIEWDDTFDVTSHKSQLWLQQFCRNLRSQTFYRSTLGPLLTNCFIESLKNWMQRRCEEEVSSNNRAPCCESSSFPYNSSVLKHCAAEASAELYRTPSYLWNNGGRAVAGLKFLKEPYTSNGTKTSQLYLPKIKALVVEYDSTFPFSLSYAAMNKFHNQASTTFCREIFNN